MAKKIVYYSGNYFFLRLIMKILIYFIVMIIFNLKNDRIIREEAVPIYNDMGEISSINYNITIDGDYKVVKIEPDIFGALREYKKLDKNDYILVNINVKSKKKKYQYIANSFTVETDSFKKDRENYTFLSETGFDGKKINSIFIPWKENLTEKESNLKLIKKEYDYFYLNVLDFSYDGNIYFNMDNYKDIEYQDGFKLFIRINDNYKEIYKDYEYYGEISFKLKSK